MPAIRSETPASGNRRAGKYLTFVLDGVSFGIEVVRIREIIRSVAITPLPDLPEYVRGVIDLRHRIVPVIDLRSRFHLPAIEATERTCIVIAEIRGATRDRIDIGLMVDAVEEVATIPTDDVEPAPDFGVLVDTRYIRGMAKIKGTVKTILEIDFLLGAPTVERLEQSISA